MSKSTKSQSLVFRDDPLNKCGVMLGEIVTHYSKIHSVTVSRSEALRIAIRNEHNRIKSPKALKTA